MVKNNINLAHSAITCALGWNELLFQKLLCCLVFRISHVSRRITQWIIRLNHVQNINIETTFKQKLISAAVKMHCHYQSQHLQINRLKLKTLILKSIGAHTNQNSFYNLTKISSLGIDFFDLKMMAKSGLEIFILKLSQFLLPSAIQNKNSRPLFTIIFKSKILISRLEILVHFQNQFQLV